MASDPIVEKTTQPTITDRFGRPFGLAGILVVLLVVGLAAVALLLPRSLTGASGASVASGASIARLTPDIPMPPGLQLQAADTSQTSALTLDDSAIVAAARGKSPDFVGSNPLIRVGIVSSDAAAAGRYGLPAKPTLSWILVSSDIAAPVSVPEGTNGEVVSQVGYVFLDASGAVYNSVLLSYFKGDPIPVLPTQ